MDAREATCAAEQQRSGATFIPPYNAVPIIAGQGTIALELLRQVCLRLVMDQNVRGASACLGLQTSCCRGGRTGRGGGGWAVNMRRQRCCPNRVLLESGVCIYSGAKPDLLLRKVAAIAMQSYQRFCSNCTAMHCKCCNVPKKQICMTSAARSIKLQDANVAFIQCACDGKSGCCPGKPAGHSQQAQDCSVPVAE